MSNSNFEIEAGNVVALISGGPPMTVIEIDEIGMVKCAWFDKSVLKEKVLPKFAIKRSNLQEPSLIILPQELIDKAGLAHAVGALENA